PGGRAVSGAPQPATPLLQVVLACEHSAPGGPRRSGS
ncbi:jg27340, partial [Pararge aegeria aegeria]